MSEQILTGVRIFSGGCDLTTRAAKTMWVSECEDKDATAFTTDGNLWKEVLGGLFSTTIDASGQWESGGDGTFVDDEMWTNLGGLGAWTEAPNSPVVAGDLCQFTYAMRGNYTVGGAVGDVAPWSAKLSGSWPAVRGQILHPPGTARTATGSGTAVTGVATPATKRLYASLHVLGVSGTSTPTITVKVQSDDNGGFSSPTDRITFNAATTVGSQISRTSVGAITDNFWRATWTISGTSPSFLFVVACGVAP